MASVLPAASVARTSKVWLPAVSAGEIVSGLVQAVQLPPSTRHSKVEPPSEELNVKLGVVLLDGSAGLESMVVFGAVRSTVQVWLAGRGVGVAGRVGCAHLEGVAAGGQCG